MSAEPTQDLEPSEEPLSAPPEETEAPEPSEEVQPLSSDYAPGCVEPDSEDGELIYSGFAVYTVRTATREYVYDVL